MAGKISLQGEVQVCVRYGEARAVEYAHTIAGICSNDGLAI